jgi:TolB-like protein/cytochrome c-type biogenesis protein CcmH/NrfG
MLSIRSLTAVGLAALAVGCASSGQMNADGVARLERARASRPNDPAVARSLGIAYYKAKRYDDARKQLNQAVRLDPRDGSATLYLGLTAEQQHDIPGAKYAYQSYVRYGRTSKIRKQLEARLAALTRQELQAAAKTAVAQEQQLSTQRASAKTVAVMPLRFTGSDSTLMPLERGMAELITIDLSRSHELTVVERAKLQALLDEISLQQSGATDSTTNVRAGKIVQAGRIVNGQIVQNAGRLRVDAAIVNTQTSGLAGGAANENTLAELFAIEKAIVLQLFDSLGVTLTTAERNAIEQRPTRSMQAFLAYSRGLRFEDQGKYDDAARNYREAVRIDPSFGGAMQKSVETQAAAQGMQMSAASVESNLAGTQEGTVAAQSQQGQAPASGTGTGEGSASNTANGLNSSQSANATNSAGASGGSTPGSQPTQDPLAAATGSEAATSSAKVVFVVKLPGKP